MFILIKDLSSQDLENDLVFKLFVGSYINACADWDHEI